MQSIVLQMTDNRVLNCEMKERSIDQLVNQQGMFIEVYQEGTPIRVNKHHVLVARFRVSVKA